MEFDPVAGPDEVVVEIAGCGVCHTDLGYYYDGVRTKHALPLSLGHEISGRVVDSGADALWWIDRAVIVPAVIPCGTARPAGAASPRSARIRRCRATTFTGASPPTSSCRRAGCVPSIEHRLAAAGLELADVSVVADAVTTPYQAVTQAGVAPGDLVIVNGVGGVGGYARRLRRVRRNRCRDRRER